MPKYVLLVDIPCYAVPVASPYREVLERRLKAETVITEKRRGFPVKRPDIPYSRGLLLIAGYLEQQGHQVRYLIYSDHHDAQKFVNLCQEAHVIGFTAVTPVVQQVYELCKQAKQLHPSVLCVLGGPHANAMADHCLAECSDLDIVIPGNGEVPFAQIVDHPTSYQDVPGIMYRQSPYEVVQNPAPHQERLLAPVDLPGPAYHLLSRPINAYGHNIRTYAGCPYQCNFCIERLSWRGRKGHNSLERVIDELRFVTQGATANTLIHFSDSIFTLDKHRTIELCDRLAKARLNAVFSCDTRVDHIDADIVKALVAARFVSIRLGIEDMDDDILQTVNKGILAGQSFYALEIIRSIAPHIVIHAYMLTGLPGSTMETLHNTAHTIQSLILQEKVDVIGNKMLVPYPGTPYFHSPEQHNMQVLHTNWGKFDRMSLPVYRLTSLTEYQIYFSFLTLESAQLQAYEKRIGNPHHINQANASSLDYVYRSYVRQVGPQFENIALSTNDSL